MKQFLRYQISGMVFIFWVIIFYFGTSASEPIKLIEVLKNNYSNNIGIKSIIGLLSALPIGVVIHQISVEIKNWLVGRCISEFNDFPNENRINSTSEMKDYILERISNLNSFYYVRFDNGILAPLFAYLTVVNIIDSSIHSIWIWSALVIGFILALYFIRIRNEIKKYNQILDANSNLETSIETSKTYNVTVTKI